MLMFCSDNFSTKFSIFREVVITLKYRFQHYNKSLNSNGNFYDRSINYPKSVNILDNKNKFYIHSLEGYNTTVYSLDSFVKIKDIPHVENIKLSISHCDEYAIAVAII